jgi:hypothetical protein
MGCFSPLYNLPAIAQNPNRAGQILKAQFEPGIDMKTSPTSQATPRVLYKYLPPERIDILENMELRFSSPANFNDTFDSHYLVPKSMGAKAKAERIRLRNRLGILCLTERPNNHLMWVHYARNHSGFVLGFDARASFFCEDKRLLRGVTYQAKPKVLSEADIDVCFYKSNEWAYEQEWRCARSFEISESRVVGIEPSLITQIIFGSHMETWQVARVMLYATGYNMTRTEFLLSSALSTSWSFENRPKVMSMCPSCDGSGYLMNDPQK